MVGSDSQTSYMTAGIPCHPAPSSCQSLRPGPRHSTSFLPSALSKQSQTPPRLKKKRNRLHLSMGEAPRMQWDALCPSLLALGCRHGVKGLVIGAVLLNLSSMRTVHSVGDCGGFTYREGRLGPGFLAPGLAAVLCGEFHRQGHLPIFLAEHLEHQNSCLALGKIYKPTECNCS